MYCKEVVVFVSLPQAYGKEDSQISPSRMGNDGYDCQPIKSSAHYRYLIKCLLNEFADLINEKIHFSVYYSTPLSFLNLPYQSLTQ